MNHEAFQNKKLELVINCAKYVHMLRPFFKYANLIVCTKYHGILLTVFDFEG